MTANWKFVRNTLMWLMVAVMTLGIVIASPHLIRSSAATPKVTIAKANNGKWGAVKNGKIDTSVTGVYQNSYGWWYVKGGYVQFDYTGIQNNKNGWWRIEKGKVNFKATGIYQNEHGWWRVENGKVNFKANSIYKNDYGWWKTTNGKVTFKENGVFQNSYGWWKVENSKVNFKFEGVASNKYGTWYLEGGKVQFSKNGSVTYGGVNYIVYNGHAVEATVMDKIIGVLQAEVDGFSYSKALMLDTFTDKDVVPYLEEEYGVDEAYFTKNFTKDNISYAVDHINVNWENEAYDVCVETLLDENGEPNQGISRALMEAILIDPLEDDGLAFTAAETKSALAKVDQDKGIWEKEALALANDIVEIAKEDGGTVTKDDIKEILAELKFTQSEIDYALNHVKL